METKWHKPKEKSIPRVISNLEKGSDAKEAVCMFGPPTLQEDHGGAAIDHVDVVHLGQGKSHRVGGKERSASIRMAN